MVSWSFAFALTQAIEVPIYTFALRRRGLGVAAIVGFGASALTHPVVWFVLRPLLEPRLGYWPYVASAEVFAWVAEAAYLRALGEPSPRAAGLAFVANATSVAVGFGVLS
jgi:p-aminobenzoyl-glutamate transporter AbgT